MVLLDSPPSVVDRRDLVGRQVDVVADQIQGARGSVLVGKDLSENRHRVLHRAKVDSLKAAVVWIAQSIEPMKLTVVLLTFAERN